MSVLEDVQTGGRVLHRGYCLRYAAKPSGLQRSHMELATQNLALSITQSVRAQPR